MDSIVLMIFRIGLLVLLWVFVLLALNAMRRDTKLAGAVPAEGARKSAAPAPIAA